MPERTIAPTTHPIDKLQIVNPERIKLSNNIPVYIFTNPLQQALKIDIVFNAGTASQEILLSANTSLRLMKEGTKSYPGNKLMAKIDFYGAFLSQNAAKDDSTITLLVLRKNFLATIPLLESLLKEPSFSPKEFRFLCDIEREDFIIQNEKPRHIARKALNERVFGANTPYGRSAEITDFEKLQLQNLISFYQNNFSSYNCKIILSGPVDDEVLSSLDKHLGQHWNMNVRKEDFTQESDFEPETIHIEKKGALQSAIQIGMPVVHRLHEDYTPFLLLNTIFGGYFGSRLMSNIREDKGYTYGIHAQVMPYLKGSIYSISTEAGTAVTKATIEEIQKEMLLLQNEFVETEELNLVKNYLTGSYMRSLDGVYNQAEKFKSIHGFHLEMDYYERSLLKIQETGQDELKALAKKYLNYDAMTTVIVGA
jgi:predicted Zn-dependent peptidase